MQSFGQVKHRRANLSFSAPTASDEAGGGLDLGGAKLKELKALYGAQRVLKEYQGAAGRGWRCDALMEVAAAFEDLGKWNEALGLYQKATSEAESPAEAGAALRRIAALLTRRGDRLGLVRTFRRLRKAEKLKPNEHRRLFTAMRALGLHRLVDRYVLHLLTHPSPPGMWARVALVLWSSGHLDALLAWSERHPGGRDSAFAALRDLALNSVEHDEHAAAETLFKTLQHWRPGDVSLAIEMARLYSRAGRHDEALRTTHLARIAAPDDAELAALDHDVAERLLRQLVGLDGQPADSEALTRLKSSLGDHPLVRWLEETARRAASDLTPGSEQRQLEQVAEDIRLAASEGRINDLLVLHEQMILIGGLAEPVVAALESHRPLLTAISIQLGGDLHRRAARLLRLLPSTPVQRPPSGADGLQWSRQALLGLLEEALRTSPTAGLASMKGLAHLAEDPLVRDRLEAAFAHVLTAVGGNSWTAEPTVLDVELERTVQDLPFLQAKLARFYADQGIADRALRHFAQTSPGALNGQAWLGAARLAAAEDRPGLLDFCRRAVRRGGTKEAVDASALLIEHGMPDQAIELWSQLGSGAETLKARVCRLRIIYAAGRSRQLFADGVALIEELHPFTELAPVDCNRLISVTRLIVKCALETKDYGWFSDLAARPWREGAAALGHWIDGMFRAAALDDAGALACFERGLRGQPPPSGVVLDLHAETALLHARHHRFGQAARALGLARARGLGAETTAFYGRFLHQVDKVRALCPEAELYPECLIDVIVEETAAEPLGYAVEPGHVATVTNSLAQGGGERQAVNVLQALSSDDRIAGQTVLVRSLDGANAFFLPTVRRLPVHVAVYGENWREATDIDRVLPMLRARPRLREAIDLLPHNMREDVVRLCDAFLRRRPHVVQIRQDLHGAALACMVAGVPTFFLHRGSLARNAWSATRLQAELTLRPMRHTYRRLLETSDFFMINNSELGRASDMAWTDWADASRFHVVHNAVDFGRLEPGEGPNQALRAELGIAPGALVVGGMFRLVEVKRPLLWAQVARRVLDQEPDAHFIIAGDGELADRVREYAEAEGFADRLHMPGAITGVGDWYRAMDVLLLTSDREGLPNVLVEAQHYGLPVVSSNVGGAFETLVHGVTGYLVAPHADAESFAARIIAIHRDPAWRARAAATAPPFVHSRFGLSRAVDELVPHYRLPDDSGVVQCLRAVG